MENKLYVIQDKFKDIDFITEDETRARNFISKNPYFKLLIFCLDWFNDYILEEEYK